MTLILVALDESDESIAAARSARELFGPDATYLAVNVSEQTPTWAMVPTAWGSVYPYPYAAPYPLVEEEMGVTQAEAAAGARDTAKEVAAEAGLPVETVIGQVGDPADAIIAAAERHHADVIVVGTSHKGFWHRLVEGSVTKELTKRAPCPVLIAGQTPREPDPEVAAS